MHTLLDIPMGTLIWYVRVLDSVPDCVRALVAGALLAVLLRLSQSRVPANDVQFSMAFSKAALIVLWAVPLVVWLLPVSRIAVFVEHLEPAAAPMHPFWWGLLGVWGAGFLAGVHRLAAGYLRARAELLALPVVSVDDRLAGRLAHWQRRLGDTRRLTVALASGERPRHLPGVRRVVLPRAAVHWPGAGQDLLIIQELCRIRKNQGRWHLFARLTACCYWPLAWVRGLEVRLRDDFEVVADNVAAACYMDDVGYRRALRQIEERLAVPGSAGADPAPGEGERPLAPSLQRYRAHLAALWAADAVLPRDGNGLTRAYHRRRSALWAEPGERLALLVGQAVLVAVVVGGVTLRQIPPEVERDYSIILEDASWMSSSYRDHERMQRRTHLDRETYPDGSR